jgi:Zn-dependent M28 family amino/carboxypeptidase
MRIPLGLALLTASAECALGQATPLAPDQVAADRMLETVRILSSDEYEGRAPGSHGEVLAVGYMKAQLSGLGLAPGNPDGSYIQDVPLVGITSTAHVSFDVGGKTITPAVLNDYVAVTRHVAPSVEVKDSDLVFVGYGVVAPEYGWDDYKGVDVRGKTLVMLINDPPVRDPNDPTKLDDTMFKGKAMTYYGRWTYKYEEASAKGAAACIIIHETGPAGYPWAVVAGSWGRENFSLQSPDGGTHLTSIEAWITLPFAKSLLAAAGFDFDALKAAAVSKEFHPVDLKTKASMAIACQIRPLASRNVIAKLDGADPVLRHEFVVYSAHWDHLGRNPRLQGHQIFNGALDNATGCAGLLEIARRFSLLPPAERPRRTVVFLAVTAEEQGLLGSEYYVQHPFYPLTKTLANINIDGMQVAGPARDIQIVGFGNSTLDDVAAKVLQDEGRSFEPESDPEKGSFYRSDHFEFAKGGVPAFYTKVGLDIVGKPADYGRLRRDEYIAEDYHKVTDQIKPWWDLRGAALDAEFFFQMGLRVAQGSDWPEWKPGCEFKARREAMLAAAR